MEAVFVFCFLALVVNPVVGYFIGKSKGRATGGVLLGFLVGPLGWLLVAVGPDRRPKCPLCKGAVEAGATKCKNCGGNLQA